MSIQPGQTLENPVTGERFTFIHTAGSIDGELLAFDLTLRPGGGVCRASCATSRRSRAPMTRRRTRRC